MSTFGINYGRRLKGPGRAVKWTDEVAAVVEAMRICREKENALTRAAIVAFADANGWEYDGPGPLGSVRFKTPTGPALVVHTLEAVDLDEYPGATIDELPAPFMVPGMRAYAIRLPEADASCPRRSWSSSASSRSAHHSAASPRGSALAGHAVPCPVACSPLATPVRNHP